MKKLLPIIIVLFLFLSIHVCHASLSYTGSMTRDGNTYTDYYIQKSGSYYTGIFYNAGCYGSNKILTSYNGQVIFTCGSGEFYCSGATDVNFTNCSYSHTYSGYGNAYINGVIGQYCTYIPNDYTSTKNMYCYDNNNTKVISDTVTPPEVSFTNSIISFEKPDVINNDYDFKVKNASYQNEFDGEILTYLSNSIDYSKVRLVIKEWTDENHTIEITRDDLPIEMRLLSESRDQDGIVHVTFDLTGAGDFEPDYLTHYYSIYFQDINHIENTHSTSDFTITGIPDTSSEYFDAQDNDSEASSLITDFNSDEMCEDEDSVKTWWCSFFATVFVPSKPFMQYQITKMIETMTDNAPFSYYFVIKDKFQNIEITSSNEALAFTFDVPESNDKINADFIDFTDPSISDYVSTFRNFVKYSLYLMFAVYVFFRIRLLFKDDV